MLDIARDALRPEDLPIHISGLLPPFNDRHHNFDIRIRLQGPLATVCISAGVPPPPSGPSRN